MNIRISVLITALLCLGLSGCGKQAEEAAVVSNFHKFNS